MNEAQISADGKYRYLLTRLFGSGPTTTFIMLNPSTANAVQNDPTIRKCMVFARRWGCGRSFQVLCASSNRLILLTAESVGPPLDDPNLGVHAFDKT
jgi:hypothetical protein